MNHSMKRRIAATLLIGLSATGIGYAEEPAATKTMPVATTKSPEQSKTGWLAEQMAVTDFGDSIQYWQAASENEGPLPSVTKNNLADIGKSYTANNLPALGDTADDYAIEGYRLGDHFTAPKDVERTSVRDNFTTYFMKDFDVTVYTGPAKERLVDNQLRGTRGLITSLNRIPLLIFIVRKRASLLYAISVRAARVWNSFLLMAVPMRCGVTKRMRPIFSYMKVMRKIHGTKKRSLPPL
nr:hypothetical protein [Veillonella denticariosi]